MRLASHHARVWASCHAEGRGFESLHPLSQSPANAPDFVLLVENEAGTVARFAWRDGQAMRERYVCTVTKELVRIVLYGTV